MEKTASGQPTGKEGKERVITIRLSAAANAELERVSKDVGVDHSKTMRHSVGAVADLLDASGNHLVEALRTLRDRLGEDGRITIALYEGDDGKPYPLLTGHTGKLHDGPLGKLPLAEIGMGVMEGIRGSAEVVGDRVHVFLESGDLTEERTLIKVGQRVFRIPVVQQRIAEFSWPLVPNERRGFEMRELDWVNPPDEEA